MKGIRMNREDGSVRLEAGVRAAELNAATQAAGLAVPPWSGIRLWFRG
jgi:FAD/FMN-containing dehydrogenase